MTARTTLQGSKILITGASAGIGASTARRLARDGANLILTGRNRERLERLTGELRLQGVQAMPVACDLSQPEAPQWLVKHVLAEVGRVDVLINNAGVGLFGRTHDLMPEEIEQAIRVNLTAAILLSRHLLPHLLANPQGGRIVNVASVAGLHGPAFASVYAATKAGLIAFTQSLRAEYRGRSLQASVVCPGFTAGGGMYDRLRRRAPRWIGETTAEDVAEAVVRCLRSDRTEWVVNSAPVRPAMVLAALCPTWGGRLLRRATRRFLRELFLGATGDDVSPTEPQRRAA